MNTQVCIVGAGPAGLLLGHLLRAEGVECVVLERRSPDYVLGRIRAGVLEETTVSLMERLGIDARLKAEGLRHDGFNLADGERLIRIDIAALTGKHVVVYGQTELTRDLMEAREERGLEVIYEADRVALHEVDGDDRRDQRHVHAITRIAHNVLSPPAPGARHVSATLPRTAGSARGFALSCIIRSRGFADARSGGMGVR